MRFSAIFSALCCSLASAEVLRVPEDFDSIQLALAYGSTSDVVDLTIDVGPGVHSPFEVNLGDFGDGSAINIVSRLGSGDTFIESSNDSSAIQVSADQIEPGNAELKISGFTIRDFNITSPLIETDSNVGTNSFEDLYITNCTTSLHIGKLNGGSVASGWHNFVLKNIKVVNCTSKYGFVIAAESLSMSDFTFRDSVVETLLLDIDQDDQSNSPSVDNFNTSVSGCRFINCQGQKPTPINRVLLN